MTSQAEGSVKHTLPDICDRVDGLDKSKTCVYIEAQNTNINIYKAKLTNVHNE